MVQRARSSYAHRYLDFWDRFDLKVAKKDSGCFEWTSALSNNGYGVFWVGGGKSKFAHRLAYERAFGSCDGVVMHLCNNKRCVNPEHLLLGTHKENVQMAAKDGLMPKGERNGGGKKLTEENVREILRDRHIGCWRMSKKHGVSSQTVKAIRRRAIWKHIQL